MPTPQAKPRARRAPAARTRSPLRPVLLVLLIAVPVLFLPGTLLDQFDLPKTLLLLTGALVIAGWWLSGEAAAVLSGPGVWAQSLRPRLAQSLRLDPLGWAIGAFFLSAKISTLGSIRPALSVYGAPLSRAGLAVFGAFAVVYFASRSLGRDASWMRRIAVASGIASAVAVFYALLQLGRVDPIVWTRTASFEGVLRVGSTIGQTNTLAAFLALTLPLSIWLAARSGERRAWIAWSALGVLSMLIIVTSLSRAAWAGIAAAAFTAFVLSAAASRRVRSRALLPAAGLAVVLLLVPLGTPMRGAFVTRMRQIVDTRAETSRTRLELWRAGLRMTGDHPAIGVGPDAFAAAFPRYRTPELTRLEWGGTPSKAHCDPIQILATQGILGGLAALAVLIFAARALWLVTRRGVDEARDAAIAVGAALVAYVVPSALGFATVSTTMLAAALLGWLAAAAARIRERELEHGEATPRAPARTRLSNTVGAAIAGAAFILFVAIPLRAEQLAGEGMGRPPATLERDRLLEGAAKLAFWDPRFYAELGRSQLTGALQERDPNSQSRLLSLAHDSLTRSVRIAPENGENEILLASILSTQAAFHPGEVSTEEVRAAFRHAVALDPYNPVVLVAAERGLIAAGLPDDAREIALRCAAAYPDYAPPMADLGYLALHEGRLAPAADTLRLALKRQWREDQAGAAQTWNDLARASLSLNRFEEARDAADSALARNPELMDAFGVREAAKRSLQLRKQANQR